MCDPRNPALGRSSERFMIRACLAIVCLLVLLPVSAFAAGDQASIPSTLHLTPSVAVTEAPSPSSRVALSTLHVSLAGLQFFDAFSTTKALKQGATEANPLMAGIAKNSLALYAVKGGTTAA